MIVLAVLSLLVWLILIFARGAFWRIEPDMLPNDPPAAIAPASILAIVPARNEADVIPRTLPSLLAQTYGGAFHVLLVDDSSEDGTGEVALRAAEEAGLAERLTVLTGEALPAGWTGKLWAMHQGSAFAARMTVPPDLLLFTDADIAYSPGVLERLAFWRAERGAVLASLMVKLRAESRAEIWLVPAFVFFFRMLYPFRWVSDPTHGCAAAAGGVMLVERGALEKAGGVAAIRGSLIDDCALGKLMKRKGPIWLGLTRDVHSLRDYPHVGDIGKMVSRSAYTELRHSPWRLLGAVLGLALVFFVPPLAAAVAEGPARLAGLLAWALMALAFLPMVRFYRVGWWTAPLMPLIALAYMLFTIDSGWQHWRGRGGAWKGRVQTGFGKAAGT